jgi:ankyrin repeat protein
MFDMVKELVEVRQADVNLAGWRGQTALFKAVESRRRDLVGFLLDSGRSDIDRRAVDGKTVVEWARENGWEDMVKILSGHAQPVVSRRYEWCR